MYSECARRSTTGRPAKNTALKSVVAYWQMPPPTPWRSTLSAAITGA